MNLGFFGRRGRAFYSSRNQNVIERAARYSEIHKFPYIVREPTPPVSPLSKNICIEYWNRIPSLTL